MLGWLRFKLVFWGDKFDLFSNGLFVGNIELSCVCWVFLMGIGLVGVFVIWIFLLILFLLFFNEYMLGSWSVLLLVFWDFFFFGF